MDADEREIYEYLQGYGEEWVNAKEVCRRAGGKRKFNEDNNWAWPVLQRMKDRQIIEGDSSDAIASSPIPESTKAAGFRRTSRRFSEESGVEGGSRTGRAAAGGD